MKNIALDAAGGDLFPKPQVLGALKAINERDDITVLLVGPKAQIQAELEPHEYDQARIKVVDAPDIIDMDESASHALKSKPNSSIVVGTGLHKKGAADAFVSAGNTGAMLAASMFILGKLDGVIRPTIATPFPTYNGFRLLVDAGANIEVNRPEVYVQFGKMAAVYSEYVMGINAPRIGLINVGEEEEKGTQVLRDAHKLFKNDPSFVGNIEGRDILPCKADVFVSDGFVGNVLLKFGESVPDALAHIVMAEIKKLGLDQEQTKLILGTLKKALHLFDPEDVGGVPFMGVNGVTLVGHGSSSERAICNLILGAAKCVDHNLNEKMLERLQ